MSEVDYVKLQEKLIGMLVRPSAEFTAIVAKNGLDSRLLVLEERQHVRVKQLHRSHRELVRVEASECEP